MFIAIETRMQIERARADFFFRFALPTVRHLPQKKFAHDGEKTGRRRSESRKNGESALSDSRRAAVSAAAFCRRGVRRLASRSKFLPCATLCARGV
jgi:hypothetical protein